MDRRRCTPCSNNYPSAGCPPLRQSCGGCSPPRLPPCCHQAIKQEPMIIVGCSAPRLLDGLSSPNCGKFLKQPDETLHECTDLRMLLLADTTRDMTPVHVRQLFRHFTVSNLNPPHILFLLIYIMALESGFITEHLFTKYPRTIPKLPSDFTFHSKLLSFSCRQRPCYKFDEPNGTYFTTNLRLVYKGIEDARLNSILIAIVSGEFMVVTLQPAFTTGLPGHSTSLSISRYVLANLNAKKPISNFFRKLDEFSSQLREEVFVPVRNAQLRLLEAKPIPALTDLPPTVREIIYNYLDVEDWEVLEKTGETFQKELDAKDRPPKFVTEEIQTDDENANDTTDIEYNTELETDNENIQDEQEEQEDEVPAS